jgi:hypothetical protein
VVQSSIGINNATSNAFDFDAWNAHHQWLQSIFGGWQPLEVMNVNMTSGNVFNNLQNCPITINLFLDMRSIPNFVLNA